MTFALIFITNHIDKIHTITNETALLFKGGSGIKVSLFKGDLEGYKTFDSDKTTFQTSFN
ncbi:hypothetical protein NIES2100_56900 [Calothrix sp. NIES-2100]|nr:hypothetical protein NIES2100_56900 [Calothrix sp. NIES-2100]